MAQQRPGLERNRAGGLGSGVDTLSRVLGVCAMVVLLSIVLLVTYDVTGRYFFNSPLVGSADVTQLLFVSLIFLGLGYATLNHSHIRMSFVIERLPTPSQRKLNLVTDIVSIVIVLIFMREVYALVLRSLERGENVPYAPFFFPAFWPQLVIAVGLTVFCLQMAVEAYREWAAPSESVPSARGAANDEATAPSAGSPIESR